MITSPLATECDGTPDDGLPGWSGLPVTRTLRYVSCGLARQRVTIGEKQLPKRCQVHSSCTRRSTWLTCHDILCGYRVCASRPHHLCMARLPRLESPRISENGVRVPNDRPKNEPDPFFPAISGLHNAPPARRLPGFAAFARDGLRRVVGQVWRARFVQQE